MQIAKRDELLVYAFLLREAEDFRYKERKPINVAGEYLLALQAGLVKIDKPANYIKIESITNMGCTDRVLQLTPVEWGTTGVVYCYLPPKPVPMGRINIEWKEK